MVIEITGNRLLAPVFGNSLYTWTALIGVVLVAFSVGGYLGGWLVDRSPKPRVLGMLLFFAAVMTLLIPLSKFAPPIYRWSIRSKIYRWYRALREVDQKMKSADANWDVAREIEKLEAVEVELAEVTVPLSYMAEFYNLRTHVAFVLERLRAIAAVPPATIPLP